LVEHECRGRRLAVGFDIRLHVCREALADAAGKADIIGLPIIGTAVLSIDCPAELGLFIGLVGFESFLACGMELSSMLPVRAGRKLVASVRLAFVV
jgi:hypothetical protein